MLSTGSKLYVGLTAAAVAGAVVYGITQNFGALGGTGLTFLAVALAGLAAAVIFAKDGDVSAMDEGAATTAAATATPAGGGLWPMVGALGLLLLVIGSVTDKRYFVAGIAVVIVAIVEWMVQGWAERASADRAFNRTIRERIMHPLELPIAGALGVAVMVYGFSRVMLAVSKDAGPAIFVIAGALITIFGALFATRPQLRSTIIGAMCAAGAVLVVAGGIAGAASGERDELAIAAEEDHFGEEHRDCESPEATEGDENADTAVAAKSNPWATLEFDGSSLTAREIAGSETDMITIDRGNPVGLLFKNEGDEEVRLTVYEGSVAVEGLDGVTQPMFTCTRLVPGGKSTWLTLKLAKSSMPDDPYYAYVPGHDDARVSVVVP